jgi:hypothetical protein
MIDITVCFNNVHNKKDTGKIRVAKAKVRVVRGKLRQSFRDNPENQGTTGPVRVVEPEVRRGFLLTRLLGFTRS